MTTAALTIDSNAPGGPDRVLPVVVTLTDLNGVPVLDALDDVGGQVGGSTRHRTNAAGLLVLNLTPNTLITPVNTYYTIEVGATSWLILKGTGAQTVAQAIASTPAALGTAVGLGNLADVNTVGVTSGQGVSWNGTQWVPTTFATGAAITAGDAASVATAAADATAKANAAQAAATSRAAAFALVL